MNSKWTIAAIPVVGGIIIALLSQLRLRDERDTISKDIAIYNSLPTESSAREELLKRIDENIASSLIPKQRIRRDILGFFTTLLEYAIGGFAGLYFANLAFAYGFDLPNWFPLWLNYVISVVITFLISLTLISKLQRILRDENGKPINKPHKLHKALTRLLSTFTSRH